MNSFEQLIENFELFETWEDKYLYILDIGKNISPLDEKYKCDEYKVEGCISNVWMNVKVENNILYIDADSDSFIVKGLIGVLIEIYNGQNLDYCKNIDIEDFFKKVGLESHLTPNRRNGLVSMVNKIKSYIK